MNVRAAYSVGRLLLQRRGKLYMYAIALDRIL